MITQLFNVYNHDQFESSNVLTDASRFEVPFKQYTSVNCSSSDETNSKTFMILFAVTDVEYKILTASFFDK